MHREVIRGAVWNLGGYIISGIATLALPAILIKSIGREAYGVYSYVTLLITQAYMLSGGLGEALAYSLTCDRKEATYWIREALGAALLTGTLGFLLWEWRGPELLTTLLNLSGNWESLLKDVRTPAGLALIGYEVAIILGWVPLAMGWKRALVLLPLGQLVTQAVIPASVVLAAPAALRLLFEVSLYGGIGLGLYMWMAISALMGQPLWPAFAWQGWHTLWKRGLWQNFSQLNGLFLNFFERTIIGRSASLSYMGLYSAGQYLSSKAFQIVYKASESLLPTFGGERSTWRRHLRLCQTLWLLSFFSAPILILTHGVGQLLLPYAVKPWGVLEMRLWGGLMLSTQLLFIIAPLMPFFISIGKFRFFYLYSSFLMICQVGATFWLVPKGYYYWAPGIGGIGGLSLLTGLYFRAWGIKALWWAWFWKSFIRLLGGWGIALAPLILMEGGRWACFLCGLLGVALFFLGEWLSSTWIRKRSFVLQLREAIRGYVGARVIWVKEKLSRGEA